MVVCEVKAAVQYMHAFGQLHRGFCTIDGASFNRLGFAGLYIVSCSRTCSPQLDN